MNSDVDLYKANALRVLCKIIDAQMLNAIDRYIKQVLILSQIKYEEIAMQCLTL